MIPNPKTGEEWIQAVLDWPVTRADGITRETLGRAVEQRGEDAVEKDLKVLFGRMHQSMVDPFNACWVPDHWRDAKELLDANDRLCIGGGNRSGKSMFSAWYIMHLLVEKPESRVACFSMTSQSSVRDQQPAMWNFMPLQWQKVKRGAIQNVKFSQKNGFTDNTFILPNGSQCFYMNYAQQSDILEGMEADLIWFDELVPWHWVQTAEFRLTTRRASRGTGKLLISATPLNGWTPVVNDFVAGCEITETRPSPLLPGKNVAGVEEGRMPYKANCIRPGSVAMWFHTQMNPWQDPAEFGRSLSGESSVSIKVRAYGWCEKSTGNWFPKFGKAHIIKPEDIPDEGTNWMCVDPAGSRNWSILWLRVDSAGRMFFYREWPDKRTYGEWAIPGDRVEGEMGPAQKPEGRGITEYKDLILELEGDEKIEERLIDPRAGGTAAATREGGQTLIDLLGEDPGPMWFVPAPGLPIEQGIGQINEKLNYDPEDTVSIVNEPQLYISESCGNLIDCMQNISSAAGDKNKFKDFVDVARYMITYEPAYVNDQTYASIGGGSY